MSTLRRAEVPRVAAARDVLAAFDWLTHPRVGRAIWTSEDRRAIVVTAALRTLSAGGESS